MFPIGLHLACPNTGRHYLKQTIPSSYKSALCSNIISSLRGPFFKRPWDQCKSSKASFPSRILPSAEQFEDIDLDLLWSDEIN